MNSRAYNKLYRYVARYEELAAVRDLDDELVQEMHNLATGAAEMMAIYEDIEAGDLLEMATEDWYKRHDYEC